MWKLIGKLIRMDEAHTNWQETLSGLVLAGLLVCTTLASHALLLSQQTGSAEKIQAAYRIAGPTEQGNAYLYFVLKQPVGFVLARAKRGSSNQPVETPHVVVSFGDHFGMYATDSVVALQLSPDARYLAIDGARSESELVWIFDTQRLTLALRPENVSGTFLHWLPGTSAAF